MINPTIADAHRLVGSIQPTTAPAAIEASAASVQPTDLHRHRELQRRLGSMIIRNGGAQAEIEESDDDRPGNQTCNDAPDVRHIAVSSCLARIKLV